MVNFTAQIPTDKAVSLIAPQTGTILAGNNILENETLYHLIRGNSAVTTGNIINTYGHYKNASGINLMDATVYSDNELAQCELLTTPGLHDGSIAIKTEHNNVPTNYLPTSIDCGLPTYPINKDFEVDDSSISLYDSHLKIKFSNNTEPNYDGSGNPFIVGGNDIGTRFNAVFSPDASGAVEKSHFLRMLNSRYGNTSNEDILQVSEDTGFNNTYAMGGYASNGTDTVTLNANLSKYWTLDPTNNGKHISIDIDSSYNHLYKNLFVTRNTGNINAMRDEDFGVYRFQQFSNLATGSVYDSSSIPFDASFSNLLSGVSTSAFPFHIGNTQGATGVKVNIPEDPISMTKFNSIFTTVSGVVYDNSGVVIQSDYTYTLGVKQESAGSGFSLNNTNFTLPYKTHSQGLFSLDDNSLDDNGYLMKNWIDKQCNFNIVNGSLNLTSDLLINASNVPLFTLESGREKLDLTDASSNGKLLINPKSITTRHDSSSIQILPVSPQTNNLVITPNVYYTTDIANNKPFIPINNQLKTNKDVSFEARLVYKHPAYDNYFKLANDTSGSGASSLNLVSNGTLVNGNFNGTNWDFTSNVNATEGKVEIFKITPKNTLNDIENFKNASGVTIDNVYSNIIVQDLKKPIQTGEFKAKMNFKLKSTSDLSFNTAFNASGWSLSTTDSNNTIFASSDVVNADNGVYWPNSQQMSSIINNNFKFTIAVTYDDFKNMVEISWNASGGAISSIKVPSTQITKTVTQQPTTTVTTIPSSEYTIISGSGLDGLDDIVLEKVVKTTNYYLQFPLLLRPFTNITVTTPTFIATSEYYRVRSSVLPADKYYPPSYLYTAISAVNLTTNYADITDSISGNRVIECNLVSDDITEFKINLDLIDGDTSTVTTVTTVPKYISLLYASTNPVIVNITDLNDSNLGTEFDIKVWLQYSYYNSNGDINSILLNDTNGYNIALSNKSATINDFTLEYWSSASNNLSVTTTVDLSDLFWVTPYNGYGNIVGLSTANATSNNYKLKVSLANNNQHTILSVYNTATLVNEYVITLKNSYCYSTPMYISRGKQDIWRITKTINSVPTVVFKPVTNYTIESSYVDPTYTYSSNDPLFTNKLALDNGVFLTEGAQGGFTFANMPNIGIKINFNLATDDIYCNLCYTGTPTALSPITLLQYQYVSAPYSSRVLTIPYYRGYNGAENTTQSYTINRTLSQGEFYWQDGASNKYSKQFNIYAGKIWLNGFSATGTSLPSSDSFNYHNLNLGIDMSYSSFVAGDTLTNPIYTKGDTTVITIKNPKSTATVTTLSASLKQYNLYTFNGNNYNLTNAPLTINSSRLKFYSTLKTNAIPTNSKIKQWVLKLIDRSFVIYKVNTILGNPINRRDGSNNLMLDPETPPQRWTKIGEYNDAAISAGVLFANGAFTVQLANPNLPKTNSTISFISIHKPMLKFTGVAHKVNPESIPFSLLNTNYTANNKVSYYMEVSNNGIYNPFAATINYQNCDNSTVYTNDFNIDTHTKSSSEYNDITFTDINNQTATFNPKLFYTYMTAPSTNINKIQVKGQKITVELHSKLYNEIGSSLLTSLITNEVSTNINIANTTITNFNYINGNPSEGITISFIQNSQPPYSLTNSQITGASTPNLPSIKFKLSYLFAKNNQEVNLNLPAGTGTKITIYTREIIKDTTVSPSVYKLALYRYDSFSHLPIDWNDYDSYSNVNKVNVFFEKRYKKIFNIPTRTLANTVAEIQKFPDLLNKITYEQIDTQAWVQDLTYVQTVTDPTTQTLAPWFSFCSLTKDCMRTILPKFFAPPRSEGYAKINIVTRDKILQVTDKLGNIICELDHDSVFRVPFTSTATIAWHYTDNKVYPFSYEDIIKRSVFGFARQGP